MYFSCSTLHHVVSLHRPPNEIVGPASKAAVEDDKVTRRAYIFAHFSGDEFCHTVRPKIRDNETTNLVYFIIFPASTSPQGRMSVSTQSFRSHLNTSPPISSQFLDGELSSNSESTSSASGNGWLPSQLRSRLPRGRWEWPAELG